MKTLFITDDVDLYERMRRNVASNGDFMVVRPYTTFCGVGFDRVVVDVGIHYVRQSDGRFADWLMQSVYPRLLQGGRISLPAYMRGYAVQLGMPED